MTKEQLLQHISNSCRFIRLGLEGQANLALTNVFDGFLLLDSFLSAEKITQVTPLLPVLLAAQQRGDMVYLADILQYEIVPFFKEN